MEGEPRPTGFWGRQIGGEETRSQRIFDLAAGIVLPAACFALDPIVFRGDSLGRLPLLQGWQAFAWPLAATEVVLLAAWLLAGNRLGGAAPLVGGALLPGALLSAAVGIAILPYSLIGLMFGIGILGFGTFASAFAYGRSGLRAIRIGRRRGGAGRTVALGVLGFALACGPAIGLEIAAVARSRAAVTAVIEGNERAGEEGIAAVARWRWTIPRGQILRLVRAWEDLPDSEAARRARIDRAHVTITGETIGYARD